MAESDGNEGTPGLSRRAIIQRGAAVGGVIWAVPVIESFTNRAAAQTVGSLEPGIYGISYLALLVNCSLNCYQVKFEIGEVDGVDMVLPNPICGPAIENKKGMGTPYCTDMAPCLGPSSCSVLPVAVLLDSGYVQVTLPEGCRILDFRVKCASCCEGPLSGGQPSMEELASGELLFNFERCTGNGNPNGTPCEQAGDYTDNSR